MTAETPDRATIDRRSQTAATGLHDLGEAARIEAGAADEGAVDIRLGHKRAGVVRLHAAAVLDPNLVGGGFIGNLTEHPADKRMRFLGLLGRRGLAGADGPDRLVSDDCLV